MNYLLWLGDPRTFDAALVGGKAANLSRLARMYHRVPDGFTLPVTVMDEAHPLDLRDEITRAISDLMACHSLTDLVAAVRSSAADEDGATASFAGQHETYLNIVGADAIINAVVRCWESARSERALEYRRRQGLAVERVQIAVLVQQLVAADVSAVVFSANPVSGNRNEVVINASWGLGESIVGGTVTPDTFIVNKLDRAITRRMIADKQRMTVSVEGGTNEVDAPRFLRTIPSLNDEQVVEIAELAHNLEKTMGYPVDVECAYAGGKLYLLQCRPVTTLN
ncbi:MAG: PEP/pyruvate-binding domain-containing protein [Candidatus Promineifilaceae bacterium]|nr:PEP/pyruvate-binding domain-containing protein [Candidatus Promineifilaceae bacterium]